LATGCGDVKQGVDNLAHVRGPRTAQLWQKRLHQLLFPIGHIARIAGSLPSIVSTGDFCPGHRELHRIFANSKES
jgi:hypothetical protein